MTPQEREIIRLWGVIQKLTQWKRYNMTDKEETVFGEVFQEFKHVAYVHAAEELAKVDMTLVPATALRQHLVRTAALCLRALHDGGK